LRASARDGGGSGDGERGAATADAADAPTATPTSYDQQRVAYNRMRHERDRANRRARVAAELAQLTPEQLEARRDEGRREAAARRARIAAALSGESNPLRIVVDCGYRPDGGGTSAEGPVSSPPPPPETLSKSARSLAKQLELSAALNRRSEYPARLHAVSFRGALAEFALGMGAARWPLVELHDESLLEVFERLVEEGFPRQRRLVVLSPDALEPLAWPAAPAASPPPSSASSSSPPPFFLDRDAVYVIGGIVDRTVVKGLTLSFAERHGLECRRLPVAEVAALGGLGRLSEKSASKTPVLNVSDVVQCLLELEACKGDWGEALRRAMPARKLVAGVEGEGGRRSRRRAEKRRRFREEEGRAGG
jgi:tRNA (guanine9-N1)-methyltransferase